MASHTDIFKRKIIDCKSKKVELKPISLPMGFKPTRRKVGHEQGTAAVAGVLVEHHSKVIEN